MYILVLQWRADSSQGPLWRTWTTSELYTFCIYHLRRGFTFLVFCSQRGNNTGKQSEYNNTLVLDQFTLLRSVMGSHSRERLLGDLIEQCQISRGQLSHPCNVHILFLPLTGSEDRESNIMSLLFAWFILRTRKGPGWCSYCQIKGATSPCN